MSLKMRKLRRIEIYLILLALGAAVMFSSFGNIVNIDERALVHALGVDVGENGGYKITMQVFKPSGSGSDTPVDVSGPNVQVVQSEGETVNDALTKAEMKLGRNIFMGHLQLICFGKDFDFSKPEELFQFALRDKNIYLGVKLCVAENSAEEIMNTEITRGTTSAEALKTIIEKNVDNGKAISCEILDFLSTINSPQNIPIPVVSLEESGKAQQSPSSGEESSNASGGSSGGESKGAGSAQEPEIVVKGTALIKSGRTLETTLDENQTEGAAWLMRKAKKSTVIIEHRGSELSVKITKDSIDVELDNEDGRLKYKADIVLVAHAFKEIKTTEESDEVSREVSAAVEKMCKSAWEASLEQNNADIFGIWRLLRHSYPQSWLEYEDNTDEIYPFCDLELSVKVLVE